MENAQTTLRQGWLARAVLSGFVATVLMIIAAVVAYGIAFALANIEPSEQAGAQTYAAWFNGLTDNILIEYTTDVFYAAIAIHLAIGMGFALIYAYFVEPRIPGPDVGRGLAFAFFPWVLSLIVFLPLVGAGFLGFGLGAGFLPILGNLILHIVYGVTLGLLYGSFGDTVDAENPEVNQANVADTAAMGSSERMAARGIVAGIAVGAVIGLIAAAIAGISGSTEMMNLPLAAFVVVSAVMGGTVGALIGSLVGLEQSTA
jgi:hypothetical protein